MTTLTTDGDETLSTSKWLLLFAACLTGILIPLCFTGPAVVLPSISRVLGGSALELNWVTNAYILAYGGATMACGTLADTYGRKRVWLIGMAAFTVITVMIPYSPSVFSLDILRLLQGASGAAAFSAAMAALAQEFHGHVRTRVFSLLGTTFGIGLAFGPLLAGYLVATLGWRSVFLLPALIAVIGGILVARYARESRDPDAAGLDWMGALSFTAALTMFTYAILLAPENGWNSVSVIGFLLGSALLLAAFIMIEKRVARPMLDLSLFRNSNFVSLQILAASPPFAYVVLIILLPARFIGIDGYDELTAGHMMIALSAPLLVVPFIAALLARWISAGILSGIGLLIAACGLVLLGRAMSANVQSDLLMPMALIGIGIGLPWGLLDGLAVSMVPKERAGMAAGFFNTVRVSADGVALAIVGAILSSLILSSLSLKLGGEYAATLLKESANHMAMGGLAHASALLPSVDRASLVNMYNLAFSTQLYILAAIAASTAVIVFIFLGKLRTHQEHSSSIANAACPASN